MSGAKFFRCFVASFRLVELLLACGWELLELLSWNIVMKSDSARTSR